MYKKNAAVTGFPIGNFINATTGATVTTGTPTCKRTIDGTAGSCANAAAYDATGLLWKIDLAAGDLNGDIIGLSFTLTDCLPINYMVKTVLGLPDTGTIASTTNITAGTIASVTNVVDANLAKILGTAITESAAGRVAGAFTGLFDTATGVVTDVWNKVITGTWTLGSAARTLRGLTTSGNFGGAVWYDNISGSAGDDPDEDGRDRKQVNNALDLYSLLSQTGLDHINLASGSTLTLPSDSSGLVFNGYGATIAFNSQDISLSGFKDMTVGGVATGTGDYHLAHCNVNATTLPPGIIHGESKIQGTVSLNAGIHYWTNCIADGAAKIDFSPTGNATLNAMQCHGDFEVLSLGAAGTDVLNFMGSGLLTLNASCVGGTVNLYGNVRYVNNGSGLTVNDYTTSRETTTQSISTRTPSGTPGAANGAHILGDNSAKPVYTVGMKITNSAGIGLEIESTGGSDTYQAALSVHSSGGNNLSAGLFSNYSVGLRCEATSANGYGLSCIGTTGGAGLYAGGGTDGFYASGLVNGINAFGAYAGNGCGMICQGRNYGLSLNGTVKDLRFVNSLVDLVRATTPTNTLDVSSTGEVGVDLSNIKQATGATILSNITVPTVTTVTNNLDAAGVRSAVGLASANLDSQLALVQASADALLDASIIWSGVAQAGSTTTTVKLDTSASSSDDIYNKSGCMVFNLTTKEQRIIIDYVGSTRVATVDTAWVTTPAESDELLVTPAPRRPRALGL